MRSQYNNVEIVGTEELEGVDVLHYRAKREGPYGIEVIEAWIGVEDGLPRKAIVNTVMKMPESQFVDQFKESTPLDPISGRDYLADPIIRRGEWPEKRIITYTYIFRDFNEAVEIPRP